MYRDPSTAPTAPRHEKPAEKAGQETAATALLHFFPAWAIRCLIPMTGASTRT
jgi:hypothetical protein